MKEPHGSSTSISDSVEEENEAEEESASSESLSSDAAPIEDLRAKRDEEPELDVAWSRVALGLLVVTTLHVIIFFIFLSLTSMRQPALFVGVGFLPYLFGGALIGFLERARGMLTAFYSVLLPAFIFPFLFELSRVLSSEPPNVAETMASMSWTTAIAPILAYSLAALFACWIGEKLAASKSE